MRRLLTLVGALCALGLASLGAWQTQQPPAQPVQGQGGRQGQAQGRAGGDQTPRDRAVQTPQGTAAISGRVVAADTGRPVKRARVSASGQGRGLRTALTDDQGRYQLSGLSAGTYQVSASKAGFVDGSYGQRRPLQPGTPLALTDAQAATNIDVRILRGGVITGHVSDEDGEPLPRALVNVQRYQYVRGERQLMAAGGDQTDDRGQYRVYGLPPGEYYVSVSVSGLGELIGRGMQQLAAGLGALGGRGGRGGPGDAFGPADAADQVGYAPTYYPGVVTPAEAGKVTLAPGQETGSIDFQIQVVPLAKVTGIVAGASDVASIMLVPQDASGGLGRMGGTLVGRAGADGGFTVVNVPPGRYTAIARSGGRSGEPRTGMQAIVVSGQNVDGVTLMLQPGVTVSGNITVESSGTAAPADYSAFRVEVPDVDPLPGAGPGGRGGRGALFGDNSTVQKNGTFSVGNLQPGLHYVRVMSGGGGTQGGGQWTLKSVTLGGADVADVPFELKPGQNVDAVSVVLTDRTTELDGTVRDAQSAGAGGVTVIAFATEAQYWRAQSRRVSTARTGQTGAYRLRGLPAGDYYVVAVDDVEQGEWFDPAYLDGVKDKATRVTLNDGDKKTLDLRGPS